MGPLVAAVPLAMGIGGATAGAAGLAGAASTLGWASAGLGAAGSLFGGISQMRAAGYQSAVAKNNARIMEMSREDALQAGQNEESQRRLATGKLIGEQLATQGASGIDVGVGTTRDVRAGAAGQGEADALMIRYNAARQAYGYSTEAESFRNEAKMAKAAGRQALISGVLGAGTSFLGGASSIASNKLKFQSAGIL